jgi:manganese oxidase
MDENKKTTKHTFSRREVLKISGIVAGSSAMVAAAPLVAPLFSAGQAAAPHHKAAGSAAEPLQMSPHGDMSGPSGEVDLEQFDPSAFLTHFDWGIESNLENGQTLREWEVVAVDKEIEVAPGIIFPAWTYNNQVPGPTFRCVQGDRLRFHFTNAGSHPHTIHFHGFHPPAMDGITPLVQPGQSFTYEFDARPFGLHPYHCHTMPLKRHIHKGLYGSLIIDPPGGRSPAHELVMVMNAFDTNFDNENEVYAVNTVGFHYMKHPIQVKVGETIRIYLLNLTEFDLVNSFHLHAGMFRLFRTGTNLEHFEFTDTVTMGQGERAILEFELECPGTYMFHAHQSEFAELGWVGMFEAV